jgi:hypothetical protein
MMDEEEEDYVDSILEELEEVSGDGEDDADEFISELVEVGAIEEVGATRLRGMRGSARARALRKLMRKSRRARTRRGGGLPSPPFGRSQRETERRAPLGFVENTTGAFFFTLAAAIGATTTMVAKVSRAAHPDRLLIVPSAPGVVLQSVKVGDEEQLLSAGAPVELYSTAALTDAVPDNFSPIGPALDFITVLLNTTAGAITGTIGIKASVKR